MEVEQPTEKTAESSNPDEEEEGKDAEGAPESLKETSSGSNELAEGEDAAGQDEEEKSDTNMEQDDTKMEVDTPEDEQPAAADDAASSDGGGKAADDAGATTDEASSSKDLPYSTRGRSTTGSASGEEKSSDRPPVKETFDDLPKSKEPAVGASFLESLTEEERRTRTRLVPDVEGMHTLRKHEIKDDIALARSLPSISTSQSNLQTRTARIAGLGRKKDPMPVDGEDLSMLVQDDRTTTIQLPANEITVPSDAFVAPEGVVVGENEGTIAVKEPSKKDAVHSPSVVESVTAFNPPRPPESVGSKKKHRVLRWERRPEDIEVDMTNYRLTVSRTREELQKGEGEYERLVTVDAHLRRHFLCHLELLNDEYRRLHDEMQIEVQKLMKESEIGGSTRTRSRNLTKVSVVMRDVLNGLSSAPMSDEDPITTSDVPPPTAVPGIGGLNAEAFDEWDRYTDIKPMKPAISWLQPGQVVSTPYGDGTVEAVFPPETPEPSDDSNSGSAAADDEMKNSDFQKSSNRKKAKGKEDETSPFPEEEEGKYDSLKPLRVQVRMPYGLGVFGMDAIRKMDSPANYSDAKLAQRWKGMIESALKVGPCIDFPGMTSKPEKQINDPAADILESAMDIDDAGRITGTDTASSDPAVEESFLPLGASLFPTKGGRGNYLHKMSIDDIEKALQKALYDGHGVLGLVCILVCGIFSLFVVTSFTR